MDGLQVRFVDLGGSFGQLRLRWSEGGELLVVGALRLAEELAVLAGEVEHRDQAMKFRRVGFGHRDAGQAVEHGDDDQNWSEFAVRAFSAASIESAAGWPDSSSSAASFMWTAGASKSTREIDVAELLLHLFVEFLEVDRARRPR